MTNDELIKIVKCLQKDFEEHLIWYKNGSDRGIYNKGFIVSADGIRGLYEGALRLAQDRGISLENFFDYKEEEL